MCRLLLLFTTLFFIGCSTLPELPTAPQAPVQQRNSTGALTAEAAVPENLCDVPFIKELWVDTHIDAGEIELYHAGDKMVIRAATVHGWMISKAKLHMIKSLNNQAEELPLNRAGNFKVGHYLSKSSLTPTDVIVYIYDFSELKVQEDDELLISFRAELVKEGNFKKHTAWADGELIAGKTKGLYFSYRITCDPDYEPALEEIKYYRTLMEELLLLPRDEEFYNCDLMLEISSALWAMIEIKESELYSKYEFIRDEVDKVDFMINLLLEDPLLTDLLDRLRQLRDQAAIYSNLSPEDLLLQASNVYIHFEEFESISREMIECYDPYAQLWHDTNALFQEVMQRLED